MHKELLRLREEGTGILLVSADLDELLTLSDRILVIFGGRLVGHLSAQEADRQTLGILMAGQVENNA